MNQIQSLRGFSFNPKVLDELLRPPAELVGLMPHRPHSLSLGDPDFQFQAFPKPIRPWLAMNAVQPVPRALLGEAELAMLEAALAAPPIPGKEPPDAREGIIDMLAAAGRTSAVPLILKAFQTVEYPHNDALLQAAMDLDPEQTKRVLYKSCSNDQLLGLLAMDTSPESNDRLLQQLPQAALIVRPLLFQHLRVDLGDKPEAWRSWLAQPHHDPAERGRVLVQNGDPSGLLWWGRSTEPLALDTPRVVAVVACPQGNRLWLQGDRLGLTEGGDVARDWLWNLKTGQSLAAMPDDPSQDARFLANPERGWLARIAFDGGQIDTISTAEGAGAQQWTRLDTITALKDPKFGPLLSRDSKFLTQLLSHQKQVIREFFPTLISYDKVLDVSHDGTLAACSRQSETAGDLCSVVQLGTSMGSAYPPIAGVVLGAVQHGLGFTPDGQLYLFQKEWSECRISDTRKSGGRSLNLVTAASEKNIWSYGDGRVIAYSADGSLAALGGLGHPAQHRVARV